VVVHGGRWGRRRRRRPHVLRLRLPTPGGPRPWWAFLQEGLAPTHAVRHLVGLLVVGRPCGGRPRPRRAVHVQEAVAAAAESAGRPSRCVRVRMAHEVPVARGGRASGGAPVPRGPLGCAVLTRRCQSTSVRPVLVRTVVATPVVGVLGVGTVAAPGVGAPTQHGRVGVVEHGLRIWLGLGLVVLGRVQVVPRGRVLLPRKASPLGETVGRGPWVPMVLLLVGVLRVLHVLLGLLRERKLKRVAMVGVVRGGLHGGRGPHGQGQGVRGWMGEPKGRATHPIPNATATPVRPRRHSRGVGSDPSLGPRHATAVTWPGAVPTPVHRGLHWAPAWAAACKGHGQQGAPANAVAGHLHGRGQCRRATDAPKPATPTPSPPGPAPGLRNGEQGGREGRSAGAPTPHSHERQVELQHRLHALP
jgi:hypothetical protein